MSHAIIALVIAQPGSLRNSLMTLLSTMPEIEIVAEVKDLSTLKRISHKWQPDLIVLDATSAESGLPAALQQIKKVWGRSQAIILVDSVKQEQIAQAAGFEAVFMKGSRIALLIDIIENLLPVATRAGLNDKAG